MKEFLLRKEIVVNKVICRLIGIVTFTLLMCFGAFIRVQLPFSPVPITLQTFFVLLSGAVLGRFGIISQMSYILLGILGLPIFANAGSGLLYLFGPTGGYLFGFLWASYFLGKTVSYQHRFLQIFILMIIANLIIFTFGLMWLKVFFGYPLSQILFIGFFPFIPGDLLKIILACFLFSKIKSRIREIF